MINKNFYPTPPDVIAMMTQGINFYGKYVCEPEGGKGDIVDYVKNLGAEGVCSYEIEEDLVKILSTKCTVLGRDWLKATPQEISHVDHIIMNPPFDHADKHIIHAWDIAPEGCQITAICNAKTVREADDWDERTRTYSSELASLIKNNGSPIQFIEDAFKVANGSERGTGVEIAFFKLYKPGTSEDFDYEGFYLEDEPDYTEEGIIAFSDIRYTVGRYVEALKAFDKMSVEMDILRGHANAAGLSGNFTLHLSSNNNITTKSEFLKELQKSAWQSIFNKMKMEKMVTSEVKAKLNKFVETQHKIPFTVRNVHQMINMIAGTYKENMDKSMVSVFDHLTQRYHENRYNVEGWKTNEAHCIGKKFILPSSVKVGYNGIESYSYDSYDRITDLQKALCYLTGKPYIYKSLYGFFQAEKVKVPYEATVEEFEKELKRIKGWRSHVLSELTEEELEKRVWDKLRKQEEEGVIEDQYKEFGKWYDFGFFMIKGFKKGTLHCKFKNLKEWELLNRRVNEIKGYPLPEKI